MKSILLVLLLMSAPFSSIATPLSGDLHIWPDSESYTRQGGELRGFTVIIEGKAAEALWERITQEPWFDECDAVMKKRLGNFSCGEFESGVRCVMDVDIQKQEISYLEC